MSDAPSSPTGPRRSPEPEATLADAPAPVKRLTEPTVEVQPSPPAPPDPAATIGDGPLIVPARPDQTAAIESQAPPQRGRPPEPEGTLADGPPCARPLPEPTVEITPASAAPDQTLALDEDPYSVRPVDQTLAFEDAGDQGDQTLIVPAPQVASDATLAVEDGRPVARAPDQTFALPGSLTGPADATAHLPGDAPAGSVGISLSSNAGTFREAGAIEPLPEATAVPGYELLGELGRGAMGVVYKARQVGLKRLVALKMILAGGHASPTELRRFRIEAEAVAALQHSNIVQVYEIGEHKGLPFFSLEFIDGGCLADKLVDTLMPVREAARLVQQLANAMAYAHGRGIIHRDLKPANILMTRDGVPKITDFGLAKKIEEDSGATRAGAIMGTPSYMAPEQAEGRTPDIGPSADVYALGAILYDLLTGRPPFKGATILETLNQVRLADPVPPARLAPKMPRDLETICLKCLQKEVTRRYVTAADLAADLGRFLAGEAITARPVPAWERAWKWCKRRPAAAALIAVSALSVVGMAAGGVAYGSAQAERRREADRLLAAEEAARKEADRQRDIAKTERREALRQRERAELHLGQAREAVDQMLTRIGQEDLAYEPRMEQVRRDLLEKAAAFYERFLKTDDSSPAVRHEAALAAKKLGDIRKFLGKAPEAEEAYRRALGHLEGLRKEYPTRSEYRADLAATATNLANLLQEGGKAAQAAPLYRQAIDLQGALLAENPTDPQLNFDQAVSRYNQGRMHQALGESKAAGASFRYALGLYQTALKSRPRNIEWRQALAQAWVALGDSQAGHEPGLAQTSLREGMKLLRAQVKDTPKVPGPRQLLLRACNQLARLVASSNPDEAANLSAEAVALGEGLVSDFPTVPDYRQDLAVSLTDQGTRYLAADQRDRAEQALLRGLQLKEKLAADFPRRPEYRRELAKSLTDYAVFQRTGPRPEGAAPYEKQATTAWEQLASEYPEVVEYNRELARARVNQGSDLAKAIATLDALLAKEPDSRDYKALRARAQQVLGLQRLPASPAEAVKLLASAEEDFRDLKKRFGDEADYAQQLALVRNLQGEAYRLTKRLKDAEKAWADSRDLFADLAKRFPRRPDHLRGQARAIHNLGVLYVALDRFTDSETTHRQALAIRQKVADGDKGEPAYRYELATTHAELAIAQARRNRTELAEGSFNQAIAILSDLEKKHPSVATYRDELITQHANFAGLLYALGKADDALAHWRSEVALKVKRTGAAPADAGLRSDLGRTRHQLALRLNQMKQPEDAARELRAAILDQELAVKLAPKNALFAASLAAHHFALADTHLLRKDHVAAAKAVEAAADGAPANWPSHAAAAAALARCAGAAAADEELTEARRKATAKAHGDRAVAMLGKAVKAGFRNAEALRTARDFDSVRDREDFKKLVAAMGKK